MQAIKEKLEKTLQMMGIASFNIVLDESARKISIVVENEPAFKENLSGLVANFNYLAKLFGKKDNEAPFVVDVNNYRQEREQLIVDLAKAAAARALATKNPVQLPAMNAYERRLVHAELASMTDVKTESIGEGKGRSVVIRPA